MVQILLVDTVSLVSLISRNIKLYKLSTLSRAQGVLRKNFKLDLILDSCVKQLTGIRSANSLHPKCPTKAVTIASSVMPCKGFLGCAGGAMVSGSAALLFKVDEFMSAIITTKVG